MTSTKHHVCAKCGEPLNPVNWWTAGVYDRFGGTKYKLCDICATQVCFAIKAVIERWDEMFINWFEVLDAIESNDIVPTVNFYIRCKRCDEVYETRSLQTVPIKCPDCGNKTRCAMTSATDNRTTELREKLDVLGIKHFDYDKGGRTHTQWEAPDGKRHFTYETSNNSAKTARLVIAWHPTPEQAIAATLGTEYHGYEQAAIEAWKSIKTWNQRHVETCRITASATDGLCTDRPRQYFELSCGHSFTLDGLEPPNCCPNCGKVVKR